MTIEFVNSGGTADRASGTTITPDLPASIVPGNYLVAICCAQTNSATSWSAGWTEIHDVQGAGFCAAIAYRVATGSDTAPTATVSGSSPGNGEVFQYSGAGGIGAFSSNVQIASFTHTCPAITTTGNNSAVLYLDAGNTTTNADTPSGWTSNSSSTATNGCIDADIKLVATSGSSSGATSVAGAYYSGHFLLELLAAPDPSSGSSDFALPVITGSGAAYSGIESVASLPAIVAAGTAVTNSIATSSLSLPAVTASGSAFRTESGAADSSAVTIGASAVNGSFSAVTGDGITIAGDGAVILFMYPTIAEAIAAVSAGSAPTIFFETISESASATTGASAYSLFILAVNSSASANGAGAASAIYALSAESVAALMTGTQFVADFTDGWAYNLNTGAASFYEGMAFNSFALIDGEYYGCNAAGIYRLTGDDDAGADIQATITLGTSRLDSDAIKSVPFAYVGAKSAEPMLLTCRVEGHEYSYEFSRETAVMAPAKVKTGKGLEGTYWQIEISNQNGANLDLDHLELITAPKSRKV